MYEYELFKMKPHESITKMTNYLNAFLTTLKKLGKYFFKEEVNNKILRILLKKDWKSEVTSIEEAQYLTTLSTDVLIGKLLTHELAINKEVNSKKKRKIRKRALY